LFNCFHITETVPIVTKIMSIPEIEKQSQADIKKFQETGLKSTLEHVAEKSAFYRRVFKENNIDPVKIRSLDDLSFLPFTEKEDLQLHNTDFICVDPLKIIDYVTTSGTLGDPVTFVLTEKDLERLAYNEFLSFTTAGGSNRDIYQLMTTIDRRFMAGLAYFLGARKLGAGIIRTGPGIPEMQWDSINRFKPTVLITVPSFLTQLADYAESHQIDITSCSVKNAICIGESLRNPDFSLNTLGNRIKNKWDISLFSTYASTEMATAFTECEMGTGGHHHPEMIIVEFLDDHNKPVKPGEAGELTITTLGVEGMPLLRFKTGDICIHYTEPCACGRTTTRLGPIIGRKKQMIKYKGTTLYPPALYDILDNAAGITSYLVEVFTNSLGTDEILLRLSAEHAGKELEKEIRDHFRAKLRVTPTISFEDAEVLKRAIHPETGRKPVRFIDRRA
jgi:phenylacetate-CoA ligase